MLCDLLRIIRFFMQRCAEKGAGLPATEGWHLRANFKNVILP